MIKTINASAKRVIFRKSKRGITTAITVVVKKISLSSLKHIDWFLDAEFLILIGVRNSRKKVAYLVKPNYYILESLYNAFPSAREQVLELSVEIGYKRLWNRYKHTKVGAAVFSKLFGQV